MKFSIKILSLLIPFILVADVTITEDDIKDNYIDIRNTSNAPVRINIDVGSFELKNNQAILIQCYQDEVYYVSIEKKMQKGYFIKCNSTLTILND